jgi:hypothetical protein
MKNKSVLLKRSERRAVLDLSASDNSIVPSLPNAFSVLSENEMKKQVYYC